MLSTQPRKRRWWLPVGLAWAAWSGALPANGQEWTRFRGPNGTGHASTGAETVPVRWGEGDHNWKVKLPGTGHGSPAVWGERIFLLCCDDRTFTRMVCCLSAANGGSLWTRPYKSSSYRMHRDNHPAAPTPLLDAKRVYACWATPKEITVVALDHDGKELWRRDLGSHRSQHGPCPAPMLYEDMVVLANDQLGESFVVALDAATGKTRWKLPRKGGAKTSYATPCVMRRAGKGDEIVVVGTAEGVAGIEAKTGKLSWQIRDVLPARVVGSPVVAGDLVIATCGTGGGGIRLVAVRPKDDGTAELAWEMRRTGPYVPTPLFKDGLLYLLHDRGGVMCVRAASGKEVWQGKLSDRFYGSFVLVGERLYCMSRTGSAYVLAAGKQFKLLAKNPLGERTFASPAVSAGRMYLRTFSHLISLGGRK